jgi:hypothetical protein
MKKFIGYYIIGAVNLQEAQEEKGLILWSQKKPSLFVRFFNRVLLGIYWVNKEKMLERKNDNHQTELARYKPAKTKKNGTYKGNRPERMSKIVAWD